MNPMHNGPRRYCKPSIAINRCVYSCAVPDRLADKPRWRSGKLRFAKRLSGLFVYQYSFLSGKVKVSGCCHRAELIN